MIILNEDKIGKVRKEYKYKPEEVLDPEKVGAYLFDNNTIKPTKITSEDGIFATTLDDVIAATNDVNDRIYYALRKQARQND